MAFRNRSLWSEIKQSVCLAGVISWAFIIGMGFALTVAESKTRNLQQIMEESMTQEELKEWKNIVLKNSASFKAAKAIAENFDQIRDAALVEFFDLWAQG